MNPGRFEFYKSVKKEDQEALLKKSKEELRRLAFGASPFEMQKKRDLTAKDVEYLHVALANAKVKFQELGIADVEKYLPDLDQISIIETLIPGKGQEDGPRPKEIETSCHGVSLEPYFLRLEISPTSLALDQDDFLCVFYHELTHFITKAVFGPPRENPDGRRLFVLEKIKRTTGFDKEKLYYLAGITEEASAELAAAYLMDKNSTYRSPYVVELSFIIAMLNAYAEKKKVSSFEAFREFFKSKVNRNVVFLGELSSVFGKELVQAIYKIKITGHSVSVLKIQEAAKKGGFDEQFIGYLNGLAKDQPIELEGINGRWLARRNAIESIREVLQIIEEKRAEPIS